MDHLTSNLDEDELRLHKHFLLVKGLHEIGHLATPIIMEKLVIAFTGTQDEPLYTTPKIGTKLLKQKQIGDAGYALEEILSGGRMFYDKGNAMFEIKNLTLEKKTPTTRSKNKATTYKILNSFF